MRKLLFLVVVLMLASPITVHAWSVFKHWKESSGYIIDKHDDGRVTCYVATVNHGKYPEPSISCVRND